ncbi:putative nucleotidyltransferase substrate binding domain-containing protein [Gulbenkiania mobilis]|uniref:putative nucleotidyltransferase substrate binding domain-containing protein n=1 Tax=Gulbenkiania mobilis TaxID=397457 RepID=UPI0006BBC7A7|nr:putative nucleotidyltransferase substrate binding domain-containing protein [Gulbenkiania mobilis]
MSRFDFSHPPFDTLSAAERDTLEANADIVFFDDESVILGPGQLVEALYVVIKGLVREMAGDEVIAVYRERDTFDARALVASGTTHRFVVHEEALVFSLPRTVVLQLTERNPRFGAFFYASVSQKFGALAERAGSRELQTLLTATVRDVGSRVPVTLLGHQTVRDAAAAMKAQRVKSVLVRHEDRLGIFTTTDFRDILLGDLPSSTPLASVAQFALLTVDIDDYLFNALLTMTRRNIRRLVVTERGEAVGMLSQVDILSYFSNHSHLIAQRLERASSLDELAEIAGQITRLVRILSSHGVKAPQLGRLVQTLNTRLFERTWKLIAPADVVANTCLVVMGSEGRGEQILKTDQDNALILRNGFSLPQLPGLAEAFSAALERFGYPPCAGGIMISRPAWRQTVADFSRTLQGWVDRPDGEALMNLAIFVDAEAVAGDASLLHACRSTLRAALVDDPSFYARFARAVEQFDTPLGLFAQLLTQEREGQAMLDLKKGGIFPIVHGVRALALEKGLTENNTFDRLDKLATCGALERELASDVGEALGFLLQLRLEQGLEEMAAGRAATSRVAPARLSTLERDLLKDALAVVKRFRTLLRHHFRLGNF